jgi:hypothetical protein
VLSSPPPPQLYRKALYEASHRRRSGCARVLDPLGACARAHVPRLSQLRRERLRGPAGARRDRSGRLVVNPRLLRVPMRSRRLIRLSPRQLRLVYSNNTTNCSTPRPKSRRNSSPRSSRTADRSSYLNTMLELEQVSPVYATVLEKLARQMINRSEVDIATE